MKRKCKNCDKEFEVKQWTMSKLYCKDKCKLAFNKEHITELKRKLKKLKNES